MHWQEKITGQKVKLIPLEENHFELLYKAASDPLIWEQHPNPNRYKREEFANYFKGAIESKGAYLVLDVLTSEVVGSTRFYDYNESESSILIGYTFVTKKYWGKGYNPEMKKLMLHFAFQKVNSVKFHVGDKNIRSQMAMKKINAKEVRRINVAYHGEKSTGNIEYEITKFEFEKQKT
jgi:RimJ/RimL family protein N-acetyltransferase